MVDYLKGKIMYYDYYNPYHPYYHRYTPYYNWYHPYYNYYAGVYQNLYNSGYMNDVWQYAAINNLNESPRSKRRLTRRK